MRGVRGTRGGRGHGLAFGNLCGLEVHERGSLLEVDEQRIRLVHHPPERDAIEQPRHVERAGDIARECHSYLPWESAWISDEAELAIAREDGTGTERAQIQPSHVQLPAELRVTVDENLVAAVEQEAIDLFGVDAAADAVERLEDVDGDPLLLQCPRRNQTRDTSAYHSDTRRVRRRDCHHQGGLLQPKF